jgi:hypothetical protein
MKSGGVALDPPTNRRFVECVNFSASMAWEDCDEMLAVAEDRLRESTGRIHAVVLTREARLRLRSGLTDLQAMIADEEGIDDL